MRCRALHVGRRKRVMVNVSARKHMSRLRRMVAPETSFSDEFDGDTLYRLTADHILLLQARSWIWMQQAMHPELSYEGFFRKKLKLPWKITPSIKKWWKEIKAKRKEEVRLQRAEVHAAVSLAGLAAALAAVASENAEKDGGNNRPNTKETAVASAAAVVAAQCAQMAETMGANRDQLSTVIGSAMTGTSVSEILALTASATTSLKGAATLKARRSCNINRLNGSAPVLPIEESSELPPEFEKNRYLLSQGTDLFVETPDGDFKARTVSIVLNKEGKVILKMKKHNLLRTKKECNDLAS
ncbi:hypothetical protein F2Q70_00005372 [Brassica cretica]|uniref:VAN3-binding protein-like auxin canalisation domain-containing protein n=1 Tax=Brassica cretica TaxID=69181 RepID=A0A8S9J0I0_BRACR|nr:hypothetical protein F2Q70_00005372 [Brassica cretica]